MRTALRLALASLLLTQPLMALDFERAPVENAAPQSAKSPAESSLGQELPPALAPSVIVSQAQSPAAALRAAVVPRMAAAVKAVAATQNFLSGILKPARAGSSAQNPGASWQTGAQAFDRAARRRPSGDEPAVPASGGGGNGGRGKGLGKDEDGGGDYPVRWVKALGDKFMSVLFRPNVPIEAEIIRAIDDAQKGDKVRVAIYEFGNAKTLDALRRARKRGVDVKILVDYTQMFPSYREGYSPERSREMWALGREGFDVQVVRGLGAFGINHNKICVVQSTRGGVAIFGSYNWKWTAEQDHYENANFTADRDRVDALMATWNWLEGLAAPIVYRNARGVIELQDPNYQWPKTIAPPPQFPRTVHFNEIDLPFLVLSPAVDGAASFEDELVKAYDAARKSIDVNIFALRSTKIVQALARARQRGLKVRVIIDQGQSAADAFSAYAQWLAYNRIQVRTLSGPDPTADFQLAQKDHHKFSVVDGKLVETGSANYTKYAVLGNFENAHFLDDATDVKSYAEIFTRLWDRALPLVAPTQEPALKTDEELIQEVVSGVEDPTAEEPPQPAPSTPKPQSRRISFNDETYSTIMTRQDDDAYIAPEIVKMIKSARKSVMLSAYELTLPEIVDALRWLRANRPQVKIQVIIDRSHVYTSGYDHTGNPRKPSPEIVALIREGFDVLVLNGEKGGIMHSKYLIIDGGLAQSGSFNYAKTAEYNHYENVYITTEEDRVQAFVNDFEYKWELAEPVDRDKVDEILARDGQPSEDEGSEIQQLAARRGSLDELHPDALAEMDPAAFEELYAGDIMGEDRNAIQLDGLDSGASARGRKIPPPPESDETPIDLNGEKFKKEYYSPNGGIMDAWLRAIRAAKTSISIEMFGFYSRDIADALIEALQEKQKTNPDFRLRMVLDAGQASLARFDRVPGDRTSGIRVSEWLKERGVDVRLNAGPHWHSRSNPHDPMFEKMHIKTILIDDKFAMVGSWNASDRAENNNFENASVIDDADDLAVLVWQFEMIWLRSLAPGQRKAVVASNGKMAMLQGL